MEKRKERLQAIPHSEKSLLSAPEAAHPLSPDVSPAEEIDSVMSIFEDIDIEAVDVLEEEPPDAEQGWRTISSGGFVDPGRRGTFGMVCFFFTIKIMITNLLFFYIACSWGRIHV